MLLAALYVGAAPAPLPGPKADLKRVQGTWVLVSRVVGGSRAAPPWEVRMVIAGDRMTGYQDGRPLPVRGSLTLDARRTPKTIDVKQGHLCRGIYRLDGDTLTICHRWPDASAPPSDFNGSRPGYCLQVWKRVKP